MITRTSWFLLFNVYIISLLDSLRISFIVNLGVGIYQISLQHQIHYFPAQALSYHPELNQWITNKVICYFLVVINPIKRISSNDTYLIVAIVYIIVSKGLYFNLSQNRRLKKVLDLSINLSKVYNNPRRNLISRDLLDVIHNQNMQSKLIMINSKQIFWFSFGGGGAKISRYRLLKLFILSKNISVVLLDIVDCQGHLAGGGGKYGTFMCNRSLEHINK